MKRRDVLRGLLATAAATAIRVPIRAAAGESVTRFGVITDVHQDIMPDATDRIRAFVSAMKEARAEFVIQLGDFCQPKDANRECLAAFNAFPGPRYHVLGNHDMDGGFTREQTAAFYGMPAPHYTFDGGTFTGVVLDGNEPGGKATGYRRYIGPAQLEWLETVLLSSKKPAILFVHQPIHADGGVENSSEVMALVRKVEAAHPDRVPAIFAGHLHEDNLTSFAHLNMRAVDVNSASYYWLGEAGQSLDYYPPDVHERFKSLRYVAAYREPLWALVEVDRANGEIRITGRKTQWVGPSALERGPSTHPKDPRAWAIRPEITDRRTPILRGASAWPGSRAQPGSA